MMVYSINQKRGNKPSVPVSSFRCESTDAADIKEEFRKHLWLAGISVSAWHKYCFKPISSDDSLAK